MIFQSLSVVIFDPHYWRIKSLFLLMVIASSKVLGPFVNSVEVGFVAIVIFNWLLLFRSSPLGGKGPKNMPLLVGQYVSVSAGNSVTNVCVSGGKKCLFFRNFGALCFLQTPDLKFALLPYYRRILGKPTCVFKYSLSISIHSLAKRGLKA